MTSLSANIEFVEVGELDGSNDDHLELIRQSIPDRAEKIDDSGKLRTSRMTRLRRRTNGSSNAQHEGSLAKPAKTDDKMEEASRSGSSRSSSPPHLLPGSTIYHHARSLRRDCQANATAGVTGEFGLDDLRKTGLEPDADDGLLTDFLSELFPDRVPPVRPAGDASSKAGLEEAEGRGPRYTASEWQAMKPLLKELYMDTGATLDQVITIMAERHKFCPTRRMFKHRFFEWGWRKNKRRQATNGQDMIRLDVPQQRLTPPQQLQHIRSPEIFRSQELVLACSRHFASAQLHSDWIVGPLTLSHERYIRETVPAFLEAQTHLQFATHQLKMGRVAEGYSILGQLFDFITGSEIYQHPKFIFSWSQGLSVYFDMCSISGDEDYELVRAVMRYSGANALAVYGDTSPNHPVLQLMRIVAASSTESLKHMRGIIRNIAIASAEGLQETLGPLHPSALFAYASIAWHWTLPEAQMARLVTQYPEALARADATLGRHSDVSIGVCYDFAQLILYIQNLDSSNMARMCSHDLPAVVRDLFQRTQGFTMVPPLAVQSEMLRAHAFACVLQGVFTLEGGQPGHCRTVLEGAALWLRQGETAAQMLGGMVEADLCMMLEAWAAGKKLRALHLNLTRPRCFDGEKEFNA